MCNTLDSPSVADVAEVLEESLQLFIVVFHICSENEFQGSLDNNLLLNYKKNLPCPCQLAAFR